MCGTTLNNLFLIPGLSNAEDVLRDILIERGWNATTKKQLPADDQELLEQVENLAFDKKTIIEYQIFMYARIFYGVATSTFSALVAYARTVDLEVDFYSEYVHYNTTRNELHRYYPVSPFVCGNADTRLMVMNMLELMDAYPWISKKRL